MRCLVGLGSLALLNLWTPPALACGPRPNPWYVVERSSPQGNDVALNAPILVELREQEADNDAPLAAPEIELSIVGGSGAAQLLASLDGRAAFVPDENLLPNTKYRVAFRTGQTGSEDVAPPEPSSATWEFTTGDRVEPPLSLEGELQIVLRASTDPTYTCANNCGTACEQTGTVNVTKAFVTLPKPRGGFGDKPRGTLTLTGDGVEDGWAGVVQVDLSRTEQNETSITLPVEEMPYRPCFAFQVTDDRGDETEAEPVCLDEEFPASRPDARPPVEDDTVDPARTSSGCQVAGSTGSGGAWLALLGLSSLSARRRSRIAP
jgi:hypothetical protein